MIDNSRKSLIRLAASMEVGSPERRVILSSLTKKAEADDETYEKAKAYMEELLMRHRASGVNIDENYKEYIDDVMFEFRLDRSDKYWVQEIWNTFNPNSPEMRRKYPQFVREKEPWQEEFEETRLPRLPQGFEWEKLNSSAHSLQSIKHGEEVGQAFRDDDHAWVASVYPYYKGKAYKRYDEALEALVRYIPTYKRIKKGPSKEELQKREVEEFLRNRPTDASRGYGRKV